MKKNFICISSFNDDLSWFNDFNYPHIIYDKCHSGIIKSDFFPINIPPSNLVKRYPNFNIKNGEIYGYNINEYLSFIISNYDNLPDTTVFIKGNIIERHITLDYLKTIINKKYFLSIENLNKNYKNNKLFNPNSFILSDGGWVEKNTNWYLNKAKHPTRYFNNYNTFMNFIFDSYIEPRYIRFSPGANYIVPKFNILKYSKTFYQNLKYIINYAQLSGESHILERALFNIWNSEYKVSNNMNKPLNKLSIFPKKDSKFIIYFRKIISKIL